MRIACIASIVASLSVLGSVVAAAGPNCSCRTSEGVKVEQGKTACLHLSSGDQLARCEMVLNNTSWKKIQDGCPTSRLRTSVSAERS
jgi:hypothetical protein